MKDKHLRRSKPTIAHAKRLRRDATSPERLLWGQLRSRRLAGIKFRRQYPIGPFVADFYCEERRLVVELDGMSHDGRTDYDAARTAFLERQTLRVIRVTNDEVLSDMEAGLRAILIACGVRPDRRAKA